MCWYVYVLKGKNGMCYKGITNNLEKRLTQHSLGQNNTTRKMGGFSLIHVELCDSREEARAIEKLLKSGWGRETIKELFY